MKKFSVVLLVLVSAFVFVSAIWGNEKDAKVRYLDENEKEVRVSGDMSPYFFVHSDNPSVDAFPLLKTKADVNIAGFIADVRLTQVYKNEGQKTIEAVYVFPLSTKSAINAMKMKIGGREITAVIEEKAAAQAAYEDAKNQGQTVSLLEQQRPNVFQMKVANIMPGDEVEVIISYTEIITPEKGIYEYVFPTVVGPRYNGEMNKQEDWIASPYTSEGAAPSYDFGIKVNLRSGMPLSKVWTPSHSSNIALKGNEARISLSDDEVKGGNRDFILRYELKGEKIDAGLMLYNGDEENFFLLTVEPPKSVSVSDIPPREYLFIVDVSGSMNGFPLDVSKELMMNIFKGLRKSDYFNILFFSGGSNVLSETPLPATKENIARAAAMLQNQRGGGGTNMLSAFKRAASLPKKDGLSRIITVMTDGYVSVEREAFDYISSNLSNSNFFAFGIGRSVNRYLIEGLARSGRGEPFVATDKKEAVKAAERFSDYVSSPLLTDIKVKFDGFDVYDVEPLSQPDLFAERPLVVYGKYKKASGKIIVTGNTPQGAYKKIINVSSAKEEKSNSALKYLWARERLARLSDYASILRENVRDEVLQIGLKYSLMTEYTSFIAVDSVKRATGEIVTVKQPLPLPQDVSNYAVGGNSRRAGVAASSTPMAMPMSRIDSVRSDKSMNFALKEKVCDGEARAISEPEEEKRTVHIKSGKYPEGITMAQLQSSIRPHFSEIQKYFKEWSVKRAALLLNIKNGKVDSLEVKSYEGKNIEKDELMKVFEKLSFPSSFTGRVEIELEMI